jgi:hypothetical protein
VQTSFYLRFKAKNPHARIGERLFAALKPFFVNKMRAAEKVCTHEDGAGCAASSTSYKGLTELWQAIVCP